VDAEYRPGEGRFIKEAVDELVNGLTKPQFSGKLVVTVTSYSKDINRLLKFNSAFLDRFPEEIIF
jgi:hypothetical protein